ncbi:MAG: SGNH/GDSL hydrolase family protein [Lachnospiraceae bacterium]|nr:SGNH/GDSL hydrolase family protein [Lachnospiraceae bacterium]
MKKKLLKIFKISAILLVAVFFTYCIQAVLMPKYLTAQKEGSMIAEYYDEKKDFNVVFIGDCEVYENFVPAVMWEEYGINSYIRGSAQQLIWQSYYLCEETLKYEKPDVIVFNVLSMKYNEPQREEYNRMSLDGMKWSKSKVDSINASMMDNEQFVDYVFPILRFHDRYKELTYEDFRYAFGHEKVTHNGYLMQTGVKGITEENYPRGKVLPDYTFGDNAWKYLEDMTKLCKDNGVELVLIKAPSLSPYWYDEWDEQIRDYAEKENLRYINYLELIDEVGIDFETDTYDMGLHLNLAGATKLSKHFGAYLQQELGVPDRRNEKELSDIWDEKLEAFYAEIKEQSAAN